VSPSVVPGVQTPQFAAAILEATPEIAYVEATSKPAVAAIVEVQLAHCPTEATSILNHSVQANCAALVLKGITFQVVAPTKFEAAALTTYPQLAFVATVTVVSVVESVGAKADKTHKSTVELLIAMLNIGRTLALTTTLFVVSQAVAEPKVPLSAENVIV